MDEINTLSTDVLTLILAGLNYRPIFVVCKRWRELVLAICDKKPRIIIEWLHIIPACYNKIPLKLQLAAPFRLGGYKMMDLSYDLWFYQNYKFNQSWDDITAKLTAEDFIDMFGPHHFDLYGFCDLMYKCIYDYRRYIDIECLKLSPEGIKKLRDTVFDVSSILGGIPLYLYIHFNIGSIKMITDNYSVIREKMGWE